MFQIRRTEAKSILSKTSGFIAAAGFTHSLTPARNCTYGCTYCYVPTMRVQGGLQPEDWRRWGQYTTFKTNAAELLTRSIRPTQIIYCSPLVDPYQPAERSERMMPAILDALIEKPPRAFVIQTRGPDVVEDLPKLIALSGRTRLAVSFSVTTNRERVRKLYEPLCSPIEERLRTIRRLREAGIAVYATLAPLLPCDPEELAHMAIEASARDLVGDPFHVRSVKSRGAITREEGHRVSRLHGFEPWHDPVFQQEIIERIRAAARAAGRRFDVGAEGFGRMIDGMGGEFSPSM